MTTAISAKTRKKEVLERYSIKDNAYYARLKKLGIKPGKDSLGSYLTPEQIEKMDSLHDHIKENGTMEGFVFVRKEEAVNNNGDLTNSEVEENGSSIEEQNSSLVKADGNELAETNGGQIVGEGNRELAEPVIEPDTESKFNPDLERLVREAMELKTSELAMPELVKRQIANELTEEDLDPDLRQKLALARDVSSPKANPAQVKSTAGNLLTQWRNGRSQNLKGGN